MIHRFGSIILDTAFRIIVPFTLIYAVYVLVHGEFSPGGGFQAGALLAVGILLTRLVQGKKEAIFNISGNLAIILAGIGTAIYAIIGYTTFFFGGNFLEYEKLPFGLHGPELHALGMLGIEIGVTICVMATIIVIFDALTREEDLL